MGRGVGAIGPGSLSQGALSGPCIIFFDEIDALCPVRGSGSSDSGWATASSANFSPKWTALRVEGGGRAGGNESVGHGRSRASSRDVLTWWSTSQCRTVTPAGRFSPYIPRVSRWRGCGSQHTGGVQRGFDGWGYRFDLSAGHDARHSRPCRTPEAMAGGGGCCFRLTIFGMPWAVMKSSQYARAQRFLREIPLVERAPGEQQQTLSEAKPMSQRTSPLA